ncbi:hypothetical protein DCCM_4285 [Desulfocucumis palustris]|uniref:Uncharacterized protein n=1 Tax=Desulfocucumis palustris TaxID=1898651 RepID=A0A2L2XG98_9FIRM|nr:hypothetical protein DCCM_4285 [Desulfocucumis palustris]
MHNVCQVNKMIKAGVHVHTGLFSLSFYVAVGGYAINKA